MKIVKPSIEFLWVTPQPLEAIERAGRTCYKSEDKITPDSAAAFVHKLVANGHTAMIEHASMSYRVWCDRGVTHEIVRHRLFSFAQESTRYCNYTRERFDAQISVIEPSVEDKPMTEVQRQIWKEAMEATETAYFKMIEAGATPQIARAVLPNALKTEIVITGNFREWLHFFDLRCAAAAHPQMREIADLIRADARTRVPAVFA